MGFIIMTVLLFFARRAAPYKVNRLFRHLQLVSSSFLALSHGSNDAQKTMGVITMALIGYYGQSAGHAEWAIPTWVIVACAAAMALGTSAGGWRIMKTMGHKIIKLKPINGFAAETAGSIVILAATHLHAPVSTTHVHLFLHHGRGRLQPRFRRPLGYCGKYFHGLGVDYPRLRAGGRALLFGHTGFVRRRM